MGSLTGDAIDAKNSSRSAPAVIPSHVMSRPPVVILSPRRLPLVVGFQRAVALVGITEVSPLTLEGKGGT